VDGLADAYIGPAAADIRDVVVDVGIAIWPAWQ
jgi:hypothetical protein